MKNKESFSEYYKSPLYDCDLDKPIIRKKDENWHGFTKTELMIMHMCIKIKDIIEHRCSKRIYGE